MTTVQIVMFFLSIQLAVLAYVVSLYFGLINSGELIDDKRISEPTLFVGILSSPDHFKERQSLRDTWLQINPGSFHYRFLIGETCNIHPQDSTSQYSCEHLNISIPEYAKDNTLLNAISISSPNPESRGRNSNGFSFYVHHAIVVHFIGVKTNLNHNGTWARVVLLNSTSLYKISSVTFDKSSVLKDDNNQGNVAWGSKPLTYVESRGSIALTYGMERMVGEDEMEWESAKLRPLGSQTAGSIPADIKVAVNFGYVYKKLKDPVVLPRGFEGSIRLEGLDENDQRSGCYKQTLRTHYNLLTIYHPTLNSSLNTCFLCTFSFTIKDFDSLKSYLINSHLRRIEWLQHTQELAKSLQLEADKFKDILFLDVVDVYRNLPQKVLYFLQWVYENYDVDYVLKTDDDTFVDTSAVISELNLSDGWDLWSCFRVGWPVQRFGRHRESAYVKEIYPTFPSGAGYVLSRNALAWLISRINELSTLYQGEDVAMGIWLEEFNAQRHFGEACYWACNEHCHVNTCNAMQLSVDDVYNMWEHYKTCGNKICKCPIR